MTTQFKLTPELCDEVFNRYKGDTFPKDDLCEPIVKAKNFVPFVGEIMGHILDKLQDAIKAQAAGKALDDETTVALTAPILACLHMGVLIGMEAAAKEAELAGTSK